jgi:hypothetical protein
VYPSFLKNHMANKSNTTTITITRTGIFFI